MSVVLIIITFALVFLIPLFLCTLLFFSFTLFTKFSFCCSSRRITTQMYMDDSTLHDRYLDSCRRHGVLPNSAVLSWFLKAKIQQSNKEKYSIVILLDQLKDVDIPPLVDVFLSTDSSNIDGIDIIQESPSNLNEEHLLLLMKSIKMKLQVVDLKNSSVNFLRDICHGGLACSVLNLRSSHIKTLNMVGCFEQLDTLNLDFCTSLTTLQQDCFACMPNLTRLSMCETRVANLWTTTASLSKLPSLVELQFQYMWRHPSPICFEKHYREYMIASLPRLQVLDNLPIDKIEKETAKAVYSKHYEYLPYKRKHKESVLKILHGREVGSVSSYSKGSSKSQCYFFSRSLTAAKIGSSPWPLLHPVTNFSHTYKGQSKRLRPRQFEYHPSNSSLMAFGTLEGEVVIGNHENGNIVGFIPPTEAMNSVLGLCWLKKYPSKLLSGLDNGRLKLFDINHTMPKVGETSCNSDAVTYEDFEQLTSVHVNSTDDQFLASGCSKGVALYDISTGKRVQVFTNLHQEPINVAKFAHHSPFLFATSSFDKTVKMWDLRQRPLQPCYTSSSSRGNVMVCFSPEDLYLLVSAIDNEVKQLSAVDGRLHTVFDIASTGSSQNYTRSYYINGRDYIISGSCDEHVVRVCCAQTGRRLRDVYMEDMELQNSLFVQSLRGDPFRNFHFSVLAAATRPTMKQQIIKVNMLASSHLDDEYSLDEDIHLTCGLGG